jgi:hypothetical protein
MSYTYHVPHTKLRVVHEGKQGIHNPLGAVEHVHPAALHREADHDAAAAARPPVRARKHGRSQLGHNGDLAATGHHKRLPLTPHALGQH